MEKKKSKAVKKTVRKRKYPASGEPTSL